MTGIISERVHGGAVSKTTVIAALVWALAATACGGGDATGDSGSPQATDVATGQQDPTQDDPDEDDPPGVDPAADDASEEDDPSALEPRPDASQTPSDSKTDYASPAPEGEATQTDTPADGGDAQPALQDLSSVARPLDPPEGGFDEGTLILEEDFQSTTPSIVPFDTEEGFGGIGSFGDRRFYEMLVNQPDGRVAAPITRLDAAASEHVYLQAISFVSNFSGLNAVDRGLYCWASNGNDPLAGSRYELLYSPQGQMQVTRFDDSGAPAALLIDETFDFTAANEADPDAPDAAEQATRIGLLCRPDAEGRAQVAVRVDRTYYVTTDAGGPPAGGGAGLVVAGRGSPASTDSIVTYDGIFVLDGAQVPLR